jgi:hypothetical protein
MGEFSGFIPGRFESGLSKHQPQIIISMDRIKPLCSKTRDRLAELARQAAEQPIYYCLTLDGKPAEFQASQPAPQLAWIPQRCT